MNQLGVAIIGCGAVSIQHIEAIKSIADVRLIAIADVDVIKGKNDAEHYGCKFYPDYQEMLGNDGIDIIHICTPHYQHKEMIISALQAGKSVFCEKPVALNREEVSEITVVQKQTSKTVGVCYQNRFNKTSQALLESVHNGELGEIKGLRAFLTWQRDPQYYTQSGWRGNKKTEGGGLLINQAIHTLDLMQLIGGGVEKVKSKIDTAFLSSVIDTEDSAMIALNMKNGAQGLFYGSNGYTRNATVFLEVHGDKGLATINDNDLVITIDGKSRKISDDFQSSNGGKAYWGKSHHKAIQNFYDYVRNNEHGILISIQDAYHSLNIVESAYLSAEKNDWITLPAM
ncbi:Gfo/Idh/MocA family oxidoreductase [Klebsiella aerogenes]|nr:Gfo/Idh/MocA family oxidoreductase [Klebsiella aerogenes]